MDGASSNTLDIHVAKVVNNVTLITMNFASILTKSVGATVMIF